MSERYIVDATKYCRKKHGYASIKRDSIEGDFVRCSYFPYGVCIHPNDDGEGACGLLEQEAYRGVKTLRLEKVRGL
jgi:hypothetical protein